MQDKERDFGFFGSSMTCFVISGGALWDLNQPYIQRWNPLEFCFVSRDFHGTNRANKTRKVTSNTMMFSYNYSSYIIVNFFLKLYIFIFGVPTSPIGIPREVWVSSYRIVIFPSFSSYSDPLKLLHKTSLYPWSLNHTFLYPRNRNSQLADLTYLIELLFESNFRFIFFLNFLHN